MSSSEGASLTASRGVLASLLAGIVTGMVIAVVAALVVNAQSAGAQGLRPGQPSFLIFLLGNWLLSATGFFVGTFTAIQVTLLLRDRRAAARRAGLLRALAGELAALHAHAATTHARGATYRDPIRLAMPARLLDSPHLDEVRDRDLLGALLGVQAAVGRYNDLVLTNALVLADNQDPRLAATADAYWRDVVTATQALRPYLPQ